MKNIAISSTQFSCIWILRMSERWQSSSIMHRESMVYMIYFVILIFFLYITLYLFVIAIKIQQVMRWDARLCESEKKWRRAISRVLCCKLKYKLLIFIRLFTFLITIFLCPFQKKIKIIHFHKKLTKINAQSFACNIAYWKSNQSSDWRQSEYRIIGSRTERITKYSAARDWQVSNCKFRTCLKFIKFYTLIYIIQFGHNMIINTS